jgi:hypothetical protein
MHLLPPSPKPFGVFVERTPSTLLEEELAIALELERQILEGPMRVKTRIEITGRDAFGRTTTEVVVVYYFSLILELEDE